MRMMEGLPDERKLHGRRPRCMNSRAGSSFPVTLAERGLRSVLDTSCAARASTQREQMRYISGLDFSCIYLAKKLQQVDTRSRYSYGQDIVDIDAVLAPEAYSDIR